MARGTTKNTNSARMLPRTTGSGTLNLRDAAAAGFCEASKDGRVLVAINIVIGLEKHHASGQ
jgi:hypothetical protein